MPDPTYELVPSKGLWHSKGAELKTVRAVYGDGHNVLVADVVESKDGPGIYFYQRYTIDQVEAIVAAVKAAQEVRT